MSLQNQEIAELLTQVAQLLEIDGANPFRIRAYRNAALAVENHPRSLADMVRAQEPLSQIPGVGNDLAEKIQEAVLTGRLALREELLQHLPAGLLQLLRLPGLGPKRVRTLYLELKISDLAKLRAAVMANRVQTLPGFGPKLQAQLLKALNEPALQSSRRLWAAVKTVVDELTTMLQGISSVAAVSAAGSFRRACETVGDLDLLAAAPKAAPVMDAFVHFEDVREIISQGETRATVVLRSGMQVDLRVVPRESYGAALQYFTGSQAHNVALRKLAQQKNLKINEYGVFRGAKRLAGAEEAEIYRVLGLACPSPELRENRGELEAARLKTLPRLVALNDIRGDLHAHTNATDGADSLTAMADGARARGYEYLAITDHSQRVTVAHGLNTARLAHQLDAIDRLNEKGSGLLLLKSMEVDILEDGSLDLPEAMLARLDLTVCSVHSKFNLSRTAQTERILRAMDNPYFSILGHPTGRLLNERPPYDVDMEKILPGARARGCFLEVNSHPARLDLTDIYCREAKNLGVKISIATDAHAVRDFAQMAYGLNQARRGWLEPEDVLNTYAWKDLKKILRRK
ncbi:MAG: DNA polymerase/3'-5' exonuclease PolX [Candidatus Firestonebacteria bacterium]|nr:DNA polymerase/3'-5' exonuclease PolX [Candidatus Firestonebacteria bacterium]